LALVTPSGASIAVHVACVDVARTVPWGRGRLATVTTTWTSVDAALAYSESVVTEVCAAADDENSE
jgi:hypothetical protein